VGTCMLCGHETDRVDDETTTVCLTCVQNQLDEVNVPVPQYCDDLTWAHAMNKWLGVEEDC
jgi:hypothetical protein